MKIRLKSKKKKEFPPRPLGAIFGPLNRPLTKADLLLEGKNINLKVWFAEEISRVDNRIDNLEKRFTYNLDSIQSILRQRLNRKLREKKTPFSWWRKWFSYETS